LVLARGVDVVAVVRLDVELDLADVGRRPGDVRAIIIGERGGATRDGRADRRSGGELEKTGQTATTWRRRSRQKAETEERTWTTEGAPPPICVYFVPIGRWI
jgi:hypothetical protein